MAQRSHTINKVVSIRLILNQKDKQISTDLARQTLRDFEGIIFGVVLTSLYFTALAIFRLPANLTPSWPWFTYEGCASAPVQSYSLFKEHIRNSLCLGFSVNPSGVISICRIPTGLASDKMRKFDHTFVSSLRSSWPSPLAPLNLKSLYAEIENTRTRLVDQSAIVNRQNP